MNHHVGEDIRSLRKSRNLRLAELSAAVGRSVGWLSQVERGETSPTLTVAERIASGLDLRLSQLLRLDEEGSVSVVRKSERRGERHDGHAYEVLTPPLPGQRGTVAIAGHRTTYGAPFRKIDKVRPGDEITVVMPYGRFTYKVERTRIVPPTAIWVTQRVSYDRLILSACHPLYSAAKRIVVFARLVRSVPRGAAA